MRLRRLLFVCLLAAVAVIAHPGGLSAQGGSDVIRGRITGSDSLPLEGARVTVTSIVTTIARPARTDKNGRFTVIFPGADGHYVVSVSMIGYVLKTFELRRTAEQDILVADANLERPQLEAVIVTADVRGTIPRSGIVADIGGTTQAIGAGLLPDQQGNLAAMAATLPGVLLIPGLNGAADGFSVLGLDPSDNTITMNGMTFNGGDLPRDAGMSSSLTTSPYDVSRGGFSGGELALRTSSGSNLLRQGMSLRMVLPQLQWTDFASRSTGSERTTLSFSGVMSGPMKMNSSFYNVSAQFDRTTNPLQTLLNTNSFGLQSNGVASDSVVRLLNVLDQLGVPATGRSLSSVVNDKASFIASFNFNPPSSLRGSQYGITVNGNWNSNEPTQLGPGSTNLPSMGGESNSTGAGVSLRHTTYLKVFLSETSLGMSHSQSQSSPFVTMPSGAVRVNSAFEDGTNTVKTLNFGGNQAQGVNSSSIQNSANFSNSLSWFSTNNKHRLKLGTELSYSSSNSDQASNFLGTFRFNSLADLEAGIPSSYSRQLSVRRDNSAQLTGGVSLGDSYRHSPDLQFQYGLRVDGGTYFKKPEYNPAVENEFGVRNDFVPSRLYVSPRVGFSWTLGTAQQLAAFEGAARGPRAILRGGISVQQNALGSINSVVNNTGLPNAIQTLNCTGPAAPVPDWDLYISNPGSMPDECADGSQGTVFSNSSPSVTLYSRDYKSPRSLRTNLSWTGAILDNRFGLTVSATHSLNLNRSSQVDLNFDPTPKFTLDDEDGRPIFVQTTSIVPTTGSIASRDARISQSFSRVNEMRSDLRSQTVQLQLNLSPRPTNPLALFRLSSVSYTFQDVREQQRGFSSTVGNPLDVYWSRGSSTARHQFGYNLSYTIFRFATFTWAGKFNSGRPYTPTVSGDINGDGSSNDRPFIFDPANTSDPALASAMEQLLTTGSKDARNCLRRQLGQLAARNSCQSGWTMTGDLGIRIDPARLRLPHRAQLQFSFQNPMGGLDMLVNGSRSPKGWGQNSADQIDPTLFYVRGFDPNTRTFKYEVNQRFGAPRETFRRLNVATGVTATLSIDLGPARERQNLTQLLAEGRTTGTEKYPAQFFRSDNAASIPNPITTIMRQQDSLRLTSAQADSMATLNRNFAVRADSIWAVAAVYFDQLPKEYRGGDAWQRYLTARRAAVDMMMVLGPQIRALLTPAQLRKLPASVHNAMDPRYLNAVRNGTGVYVSNSSGIASGIPIGFESVVSAGGVMTIVR